MTPDPRAAIRAAVKRLIASIKIDAVEVTVQRRDIEVLLAAVASGRRMQGAEAPVLHPAQQ